MDKRKNATKNKNGGLKSGRQKLKAKMLKSYYGNPLTIRFWSPCKFKIASNYLVLEGSDTYFPQEEIYLAAEKTKNTKLFYVTDG